MSFSRIDFNLGINKWASTAILKFPYNSFPMSNAFNSLTGSLANRTGHNTHGYVIPRAGSKTM